MMRSAPGRLAAMATATASANGSTDTRAMLSSGPRVVDQLKINAVATPSTTGTSADGSPSDALGAADALAPIGRSAFRSTMAGSRYQMALRDATLAPARAGP